KKRHSRPRLLPPLTLPISADRNGHWPWLTAISFEMAASASRSSSLSLRPDIGSVPWSPIDSPPRTFPCLCWGTWPSVGRTLKWSHSFVACQWARRTGGTLQTLFAVLVLGLLALSGLAIDGGE